MGDPKVPEWLKCKCGNTDPKRFTYSATITEFRKLSFDENGLAHLSQPQIVDDDGSRDMHLICEECPDGCILLPSEKPNRHEFWDNMDWE